MENIDRPSDPSSAHEALADIDSVQRAVRDTPWPVWLYPLNAALLGVMALSTLLDEYQLSAWLASAAAVVLLNVVVGLRIGTPWVLPTSRAFLASVVASAACLVGALVVSDLTDLAWPVIMLAVGTAGSYLAGSVAHRRSTGR